MTDSSRRSVSSWNRQTYLRLKQALSLNLRRQIFVAVCDDPTLRNRLAAQLHAQLAYPASENGVVTGPKLVSLNLNLTEPNPVGQMQRWLSRHPELSHCPPAFQILGVEQLTKQSASVQGLFLRSLRGIGRRLPQMESSLLLWLPRPWFLSIQQSAPEFWRWHTGIFEFEGEPTPLEVETPLMNPPELRPLQDRTQENGGPTLRGRPLSQDQPLSDQEKEVLQRSWQSLKPVQTWQEIAQLQQQSASPEALAEAYLRLGNYYRDRIEQSQVTPENLNIAIQAYEQALSWLEETSPLTPDILNDVGNLYWMLSRYGKTTGEMLASLQSGVRSYQQALTKLLPETAPQTYAMIQNNLGAAYGDLARYENKADNLQRSIQSYRNALQYRPKETEPLKYAATQNNLGTAYWHLAQQQQPVENLKAAIVSYQESLDYYTPEREPMGWAMLQNNIGTAFWNLSQFEQPEVYLPSAIQAYEAALQYRTPEAAPAACAATQNNLGTAYWHLSNLDSQHQQQWLGRCIQCYEEATQLAEQLKDTPLNFDLFATHNNLALAYSQFATDPKLKLETSLQNHHLDAALHHQVLALQGFQNQPEAHESALNALIKILRSIYEKRGIQGQNQALSKVPGQYLSELMRRL